MQNLSQKYCKTKELLNLKNFGLPEGGTIFVPFRDFMKKGREKGGKEEKSDKKHVKIPL